MQFLTSGLKKKKKKSVAFDFGTLLFIWKERTRMGKR